MDMTPGYRGWFRFETPGVPGAVSLRLDDRGTLVELHVDAGGGEVTAGALRGIALGQMKARAATFQNTRPDLALMLNRADTPDPQVSKALDLAFFRRRRDGKGNPAARLDPPTAGLSEDFLRAVATAYTAAVGRGERPNVALAEQTGYPIRSVERWVYLARKAGLLPATRRGSVA